MSEKNNKYTPNLRFPEFTGEWEEKTLGEVSPVIFDGTHQTPHYVNSGIPFYSIENIVSDKPCKYIAQDEHMSNTKKNKTEKGDILITRIGTIGFAKIVDWDGEFSTYVSLATIKKSSLINTRYLLGYLQSEVYQKEMRSKSLMNAVPCKINMEDLKNTRIASPKEQKEQQKIASCLSAMDDLIAAQAEKVEALKEKKTGLMQQLFPQPGETTPRLRFPEFTGEWKDVLVKDFCDINTGKSNTQDQVEDGLYPFYIRSATPVRSNRFLYDCEAVITIGDGQIGKVFHYVNGKFDLHQRCYMMSNFKGVDCRYFYYFFSCNFYERAIRLSAKAVVDSVRLEMISDMPVFLPPTFAEQQKIADCLSELDDLIASETKQLEALKDHKKGLMQQLFPQPAK